MTYEEDKQNCDYHCRGVGRYCQMHEGIVDLAAQSHRQRKQHHDTGKGDSAPCDVDARANHVEVDREATKGDERDDERYVVELSEHFQHPEAQTVPEEDKQCHGGDKPESVECGDHGKQHDDTNCEHNKIEVYPHHVGLDGTAVEVFEDDVVVAGNG